MDLYQIWFSGSSRGRNQLCGILLQSAHGFRISEGSNFAISHWLGRSPLTQCWRYRAASDGRKLKKQRFLCIGDGRKAKVGGSRRVYCFGVEAPPSLPAKRSRKSCKLPIVFGDEPLTIWNRNPVSRRWYSIVFWKFGRCKTINGDKSQWQTYMRNEKMRKQHVTTQYSQWCEDVDKCVELFT